MVNIIHFMKLKTYNQLRETLLSHQLSSKESLRPGSRIKSGMTTLSGRYDTVSKAGMTKANSSRIEMFLLLIK